MALEIKRNESGVIRVFAVNRTPDEVRLAMISQGIAPLAHELLGHNVSDNGVELFPVADLTGVGLSGYLADGYAVPDDQLAGKRARLDGLDGYVLLVFSSAFDGKALTLAPGPDVTLIDTFGEAQPDMTIQPLDSEAAQAYSGVPRDTPAIPPKGAPGGSLVVVGLIVLTGLVLWWALA